MEENDGKSFRFIILATYACVLVDNTEISSRPYHHLNGSIFTIKNIPGATSLTLVTDDDQLLVCQDNKLRVTSSMTQYNTRVIIEGYPDYINEIYYLKYDNLYLNSCFEFQQNKDEALLFHIAAIDEVSRDFSRIISHPEACLTNTEYISVDGVDLFHTNVWFWLYLMNEGGLANAHEYHSELIFGSDLYYGGMLFRFKLINNNIVIESSEGYLGYNSNDDKVYLFSSIPEFPLSIIPVKLRSMFVITDGLCFYYVDFVKASFGTLTRVSNLEEASTFQFVSIA